MRNGVISHVRKYSGRLRQYVSGSRNVLPLDKSCRLEIPARVAPIERFELTGYETVERLCRLTCRVRRHGTLGPHSSSSPEAGTPVSVPAGFLPDVFLPTFLFLPGSDNRIWAVAAIFPLLRLEESLSGQSVRTCAQGRLPCNHRSQESRQGSRW